MRAMLYETSYASCSSPAWCSAPLQVWKDMRKQKQGSEVERISLYLNQQCLDTGLQGRIQSLIVPGAQPPVLTVIVSLCGSNDEFISNCASPQRKFAQLMYISGLYKDILDSHEFWVVTLDGNYWQLRHRESQSFGFKYVLIKKSPSLIGSAGFYGNSLCCPNLQHILYISACIQRAAFCRAWNLGPICIRQGPEIKILVPTVLSFEKAQPTLELAVLVALQELG